MVIVDVQPLKTKMNHNQKNKTRIEEALKALRFHSNKPPFFLSFSSSKKNKFSFPFWFAFPFYLSFLFLLTTREPTENANLFAIYFDGFYSQAVEWRELPKSMVQQGACTLAALWGIAGVCSAEARVECMGIGVEGDSAWAVVSIMQVKNLDVHAWETGHGWVHATWLQLRGAGLVGELEQTSVGAETAG